jgi:hypothetical protein
MPEETEATASSMAPIYNNQDKVFCGTSFTYENKYAKILFIDKDQMQ